MNIFIRELRANRKALIIWSVCMVLFVLSGMGKYTAYSAGGSSSAILNDLPKTVRALLGFGPFDVTQISGFFAFLVPYLELTVAIHAVLLGNGIISKEERDKTSEFLIAKPVSRNSIVTYKLLAALFNVVVINVVTSISCIFMVAAYNKGESITGEILWFMFSMLIIQLIFLLLGALLASVIRRPKASGSIATGIIMGAYVISKVTDMTDKVNALNILTPFKYFDMVRIVDGGGLQTIVVLLTFLLIAVLSISTYYFYLRRDISN
jgi:ABC-2 type transport system permease protein